MGTITGVDTSLFRKAVWYYTHSLFGVKYDDYDYNQIRILLKSPLRKFIKIICSSPQKITKSHYDSIMKEFTHSEKVRISNSRHIFSTFRHSYCRILSNLK